MNFLSKILFSWTIFIASTVSNTNGMSRRFNSFFIMTLWLISLCNLIWGVFEKYIAKVSSTSNEVLSICIAVSAAFAFILICYFKKQIDKTITLEHFKNYDTLIYFLSVFFILLNAFSLFLYMNLILHIIGIIYLYFTKSTFGLKLDEQAALDKNNS